MSNGYTTINVDGAEVGLKFGLPAVTEMFEKPLPVDASTSIMYTASLLFAGYKNYCLVKAEQPRLSFEPFYDLVEDSFLDAVKMDALNNVVAVFTESKFVKAGTAEKKSEEALTKKKIGQEKKLKPSATVN